MTRAVLLATTSILASPTAAFAQTTTPRSVERTPVPAQAETRPGSSAQAADAQASEGLNDILVTAQRHDQNLQRAAVAVAVVSSSDLVSAGITQVDPQFVSAEFTGRCP